MASTEVGESSEPLKHNKTWVFKVSIHCEGCKRKVKKLLQSLPGVHDIEIETKLQRVVVTGDVSPESLIRKLVKAGKHAELWPEKVDTSSRSFNPPEFNSRKTEKPPISNRESISEGSAVPRKEIKPPATKTEFSVEDSTKVGNTTVPGGGVQDGSGGKGGGKVDEGVGKSEVAGRGGKAEVEIKAEEKKPETGSVGNQASQPVVEKKEEETQKTGGATGGGTGVGGEGKLKKKKKKQNSNKNGIAGTSSSASPPVIGGSLNHTGGGSPPPPNQTPPRHHGYQYPPPHYYTPPPPPVYTVSYHTAHPPMTSHAASYYATPTPHSYAYTHETEPPQPPPHPPSDFDPYTQQPLDSFEMFSDENPNGCLVM